MTKYLTINTARKNREDLLNGLATFGWKLHSDRTISFKKGLEVYGAFDDDDDKPLMELTFVFDNKGENAERLYELSLKYLELKKTNMLARDSSIAKLVTGLVFGTLLTTGGIIMMISGQVNNFSFMSQLGLVFFLFGFPAYPLCIFGIVFKKKNAKRGITETTEAIELLKREAESLR